MSILWNYQYPWYYWYRIVRDGIALEPDILWLIEPGHAESFAAHSFESHAPLAEEILGHYEYWSEPIAPPRGDYE
jgi:hypothetical protein